MEKNRVKKVVISHRKTCSPSGTGLSHYILMKDTDK